ncbi:MAG: DMT family transporter [Candidatus Aenigmarchaeota archaeon]|nr:DMT family transporter [Candidatus Aenigmarchaeota archaeon]
MDNVLKGSLYTVIAAVIWGLTPIIEKAAMGYVNPVVLGAWRYFLSGIMIFVYLRTKKIGMDVDKVVGKRLFFASILGSALLPAFFYMGLFLTDPITASSVSNIGVVWVALFGLIFLKEKIKVDEFIGTMLVLAGVFVMLNKIGFDASIGALMLAGASVFGAITAVIERKSLRSTNTWVVALYDRLVGGSISMIVSLFLFGAGAVVLSSQAWYYLLFLAFFGSMIPALLFLHGLSLIEAERSVAIISTAPLFTVLFTALFTNSPVTQGQFIGAVLIAGGVLVLSVSKKLFVAMKYYVSVVVNREMSGIRRMKSVFLDIQNWAKAR